MKRWSLKEIELLKKEYPVKTNEELEILFDRSYISIYKKAYNLKLKRNKDTLFKIRSECRSFEKSSTWKGGVKETKSGYIMILKKEHPFSDVSGYIMEHRLIMEQHIGRYLKSNEIVHHKNSKKNDNRIENLELMRNGDHTRRHHIGSKRTKKTKLKISEKAKQRFKDKTKHPSYKEVKKEDLIKMRKEGFKIREICKTLNICKRTYYNKIMEVN